MSGAVPPRPDVGFPGPAGEAGPPPATWRAIEALPVGFIALGATTLVGVALAAIFPGSGSGSLRESPGFFTFANMAQEILLVASVVLWIRLVNKGPMTALGLPPRRPWADAGTGVVAALGMLFVSGLVLQAVQRIVNAVAGHTVSGPQQVPNTVTGGYLVVSGIVVVLMAPVAEETFFRGFLYKGLRRRFSTGPAALISGVLFGLVHFAGLRFLLILPSLMVVGVVLALVYERRQSLLASVVTHATFNLIGFLFIAFGR